jgi:hypothetical protein
MEQREKGSTHMHRNMAKEIKISQKIFTRMAKNTNGKYKKERSKAA